MMFNNENALVEAIDKCGLGIWPNFLSPETLLETRKDFDLLKASGQFRRAGVGHGQGGTIENEVRRDEIYWLNRGDSSPIQTKLWERLDQIKQNLNRTIFLGIREFEGHYAAYAPGGFYRRHLDAFQDNTSRVVSFVLYLNLDWKPEDGGQLKVYGPDESHTMIDPIGGTLVCFLSGESEHEVLPSKAYRASFTGWFKT